MPQDQANILKKILSAIKGSSSVISNNTENSNEQKNRDDILKNIEINQLAELKKAHDTLKSILNCTCNNSGGSGIGSGVAGAGVAGVAALAGASALMLAATTDMEKAKTYQGEVLKKKKDNQRILDNREKEKKEDIKNGISPNGSEKSTQEKIVENLDAVGVRGLIPSIIATDNEVEEAKNKILTHMKEEREDKNKYKAEFDRATPEKQREILKLQRESDFFIKSLEDVNIVPQPGQDLTQKYKRIVGKNAFGQELVDEIYTDNLLIKDINDLMSTGWTKEKSKEFLLKEDEERGRAAKVLSTPNRGLPKEFSSLPTPSSNLADGLPNMPVIKAPPQIQPKPAEELKPPVEEPKSVEINQKPTIEPNRFEGVFDERKTKEYENQYNKGVLDDSAFKQKNPINSSFFNPPPKEDNIEPSTKKETSMNDGMSMMNKELYSKFVAEPLSDTNNNSYNNINIISNNILSDNISVFGINSPLSEESIRQAALYENNKTGMI